MGLFTWVNLVFTLCPTEAPVVSRQNPILSVSLASTADDDDDGQRFSLQLAATATELSPLLVL